MSRIQLSDNTQDVVVKMSDGNPGAITAMMELLTRGEEIDPQSGMGGLGNILLLDTYEIYGTAIYILWNDKCNRDIRQLILLLRASQLGFVDSEFVKEMAANQMRKVDLDSETWDEIDTKVCTRLDGFQKKIKT